MNKMHFCKTRRHGMKTLVNKFKAKTDGNVGVMFSFSMLALLLSVSLAADVSLAYNKSAKLQSALDSAVLAAALNADENNFESFGQEIFNFNLLGSRFSDTSLNIQQNNDQMTGVATGRVPLIFAGVLPLPHIDVRVRSVADIDELRSTPCIIALNPTANPGITINGNTKIEGSECEIHSHSQQNNSLSASGGIDVNVAKTCVAGGVVDNSQGGLGPVITNCAVHADPYVGIIPEPASTACDFSGGNYDNPPGNKVTLQPGVYCNGINFNNSSVDVEFAPGLYVIQNGNWNVNGGNWSGNGVTFYFYDNSIINFNSGVSADLNSPTTGDYAGIFMTERPGLSRRDVNLNSGSSFDFDGVIYLPSKHVTINAGSSLISRNTIFVTDRITFNGSLGFDVDIDGPSTLIPPYLSE